MKGIVHTLEAAIAVTILLVVIIFTLQVQQEEVNLTRLGYNCLKNLDNRGILRYSAVNNLDFSSNLQECLPELVDFEVKVCDTSDCPAQNIPEKTVFLSSYLIAGDDDFNPKLINLWLWSK